MGSPGFEETHCVDWPRTLTRERHRACRRRGAIGTLTCGLWSGARFDRQRHEEQNKRHTNANLFNQRRTSLFFGHASGPVVMEDVTAQLFVINPIYGPPSHLGIEPST